MAHPFLRIAEGRHGHNRERVGGDRYARQTASRPRDLGLPAARQTVGGFQGPKKALRPKPGKDTD